MIHYQLHSQLLPKLLKKRRGNSSYFGKDVVAEFDSCEIQGWWQQRRGAGNRREEDGTYAGRQGSGAMAEALRAALQLFPAVKSVPGSSSACTRASLVKRSNGRVSEQQQQQSVLFPISGNKKPLLFLWQKTPPSL
jgi:hypothetical protein